MFNQTILKSLLTATFLLVLAGCSSGGSSGGSDSATTSVVSSLSGVAQKGAFVKDSNVTLCKLDEKMLCTNDVLEAKVSDEKGSYEFKTLPWSGLSRLSISGYYLDELTGKTSLFPATITAIVNIKSNVKQKKNTNLLTDIRAKRMKVLVDDGKSVDEASEESKDDVKKLFNVSSDDFTALNIVDFSEGKASVNVELLRISAAVANAQDPVGTLEELMKIYKDDGIEAVLNSTLYRTLMGLIEKVKVKEVLIKMVGADEANAATITDIAPFAVANIVTFGVVNSNDKVRITLIGTEFIDAPSISISSSDNLLGIDKITLADDNKSAILDMNRSTSCEDINATFTIDYMALKNLTDPIRTNKLKYKDENSICTTSNVDDDENTTPITVDPTAVISLVPLHKNQIRLTLLGTEFENYTDTINAQLITSSSTLSIVSKEIADNNKSVIFTLNEETDYCAENNVTIGLYTFNLKGVPNESDTFKSNKIKYVSPNSMAECGNGNATTIPIPFNRAPTVSITPSTVGSISINTVLELNATAVDVNSEDTVTLQWLYKREGGIFKNDRITSSQFVRQYDTLGRHIVNVTATDNHGAHTTATIEFEVVAVNHAPTVSISPSEDKNIHVGERVLLKSRTADEDGDELSISWKIKESAESDFTTVANYGGTGFSHTFDSIGTYLVVVEVVDGNGSKADANITVNVSAVPAVVMTLPDVNVTVAVKGSVSEQTNFNTDILPEAAENPQHGTVQFYKIGNEVPAFTYTSTDCFIGTDSFVYKSGDDYGRVNVKITSGSSLQLLNETKTLFNTETISGEYLRAKNSYQTVQITTDTHGGSATLTVVGNEVINYNYDPDDSFVGNDFFEYNVSETINECSYSKTGRIDFKVSEYVAAKQVISTCRDPYTIGTELYSTEGTLASTHLMKDLTPGVYSSGKAATTGFMSIYSDLKIGDVQYFVGYYSAGGTKAFELYETKGTPESTIVHDLNPHNVFTSEFLWGSSHPGNFVRIDDQIFFRASDSNYSRYGMYKADGTTVERIADHATDQPFVELGGNYYYLTQEDDNVTIHKFAEDFSSSEITGSFLTSVANRSVDFLAVIGDKILFTEYKNSSSKYTYFAVSTLGNVESLTDLTSTYSKQNVTINGKVYFFSNSNSSTTAHTNIITTDGTAAGTNIAATFDGAIYAVAVLHNKLYFKGVVFGEDWNRDINLYEYTPSGIVLIADIAEGDSDDIATHNGMSDIDVVDGKLIYESVNIETIDGEKRAYELLWASDGTASGTRAILRRNRTCVTCQAADLREIFELNGAYYFQDVSGRLYKTDFNENGTTIILDEMCDITPNYLTLENISDVKRGVIYEANLTVEGISYPQTKLRIEDGEYSLDNGLTWSSEATTVANGQSVKVRHTSSSEYDTTVTTTLYVGQRYTTFQTTTETETLSTPNQFTFTDITNASLSTMQTANITISGINTEVPLSITGGEYSLDSQSTWGTLDVNITNGQVVYVRHTSASSNEATVDTVLTVGSVSDTFSSTTRAATTNNGETVAKDALMWEDTEHTRTATQTWKDAYSYCADLTLDGYDDWRLPNFNWDSEVNELGTIMIGSESSSAGDRVIDEAFVLITQEDNIWSWTNEVQGDTSHVVGIFSGGSSNFDGLGDTELVGVRCVRDVAQ